MEKNTDEKRHSAVDKALVALFLKMSPEERLKANDNAVRAILELKRFSNDPAERQRLAVLEETLRQLERKP